MWRCGPGKEVYGTVEWVTGHWSWSPWTFKEVLVKVVLDLLELYSLGMIVVINDSGFSTKVDATITSGKCRLWH